MFLKKVEFFNNVDNGRNFVKEAGITIIFMRVAS